MSEHSASELSPNDRKILAAALTSGHAFEKSFTSENESTFRAQLEACAAGESILLKKLAELAPKVSLALGPKHLMALLVPLERLAGRAARDEEFLYLETDSRYHLPFAERRTNLHARKSLEHQRIILCENIRSAFNIGSVYRTAEAFRSDEVWLCGYSPDPQKTAMGADALVQTRRFDRTEDAIQAARGDGFSIVALENSPGAISLEEFQWPKKTVLILGNERFGVDSQTLKRCDSVVRISTSGQKNSLNVGIAFGIAAAGWRSAESQIQTDAMSVKPIGFLRGGFENPQVAPRQGAYASRPDEDSSGNVSVSTIELDARFEGRPSNFEQALKDLDGFERAWIVFGFDRSEGWNPQVRPPRGDGQKRGLFATRSPHRPNRLGISCVKIESVSGRKIEISEHDLLDGTPIFDIKPYVPEADAFPDARAGWVDQISLEKFETSESPRFREKANWLEQHGESRLRAFAREQLCFQPYDKDRKRVEVAASSNELHSIAFRTWRIGFCDKSERQLELIDLRSGYSQSDLLSGLDEYGDKELHRAFLKKFGD